MGSGEPVITTRFRPAAMNNSRRCRSIRSEQILVGLPEVLDQYIRIDPPRWEKLRRVCGREQISFCWNGHLSWTWPSTGTSGDLDDGDREDLLEHIDDTHMRKTSLQVAGSRAPMTPTRSPSAARAQGNGGRLLTIVPGPTRPYI
jgi:hypothetical protein